MLLVWTVNLFGYIVTPLIHWIWELVSYIISINLPLHISSSVMDMSAYWQQSFLGRLEQAAN